MRFSILHLSDLHRDLTDEIPNAWLIDSIERDIETLANEQSSVARPTLCVVSGDLVYGVRPNSPDADAELKRQNSQSLEFLVELADRLFCSNRDRVVIIPGNHDVAFNRVTSSSALVPLPSDKAAKADLVREYFSANTQLRWSWSDLAFYRIEDHDGYLQRFSYFRDLYEQFYQGSRIYPVAPDSQFDFFDFQVEKLSIVALNSCHNNDPWRRAGQINSTALANACRQLRSPSRAGWLLAATWHHNLVGGPSQDDYLDPEFLQLLIESGVSLGLHGHQHRSDWFDERYRLGPKARKLTIVSAATLCAGPTNLSPGTPRGYNVLEIDNEAWVGRLHQRQMVNLQFSMPAWGPGRFVDTNESFVDFELAPPVASRPAGLDMKLALEAADSYLGRGEWEKALAALSEYWSEPLARRMGLRALEELDDPGRTINMLDTPSDVAEAVILGSALLIAGDTISRKRFLESPFIARNTDASVTEIVEKLTLRMTR
ncbi:metallophosphoesterase family protein [Methylocystis heyeri]|uniref:Calcineurin-like phosphoesterase domain-containing protein n=1 Tax=Methylocystis heyeri TaxID=391905 RepID=A0A6B8KGH0_9HYPH|nr:metallophosphoesterase [Methylocystis heyeri]QGM46091.1 hypothetical protein H2LOC_010520 [Methylocystis heyeri]